MSLLSELKPMKKSTFRKKRIGRGNSSGWGTTAARGYNGQKSRSGSLSRATFEGGQMPIWQRLPKFGFTPISKTKFQIVSLDKISNLPEQIKNFNRGSLSKRLKIKSLENFEKDIQCDGNFCKVTPFILQAFGLIKKQDRPIKILKGKSQLKQAFHIEADAFSLTAESAIKDTGGVVVKRVKENLRKD